MKKVSLIKYSLTGVPVTRKTLIHRALYGYVDHSNKGTYSYKRKGALNGLEYIKLGSGIIIIDTRHVDKLIPLFKKYKIKTRILDMAML